MSANNSFRANYSSTERSPSSTLPVWIYVMFRRNPSSGHDKIDIKIRLALSNNWPCAIWDYINCSSDGPVFWTREVIYVFCCSCHFEKHEVDRLRCIFMEHLSGDFQKELLQLLEKTRNRIERVCLVDRPIDYPFLPDSLFSFMANALPKLQVIHKFLPPVYLIKLCSLVCLPP